MATTSFGGQARHGELADLGVDQHLQYASWSQGTFANRPAAGRAGRIYYATDNGFTYYDLGTSWIAGQSASLASTGGTLTGTLTLANTAPLVMTYPSKLFWNGTASDEATPFASGWLGATTSTDAVPHYGMGHYAMTDDIGTTGVFGRSISNFWGMSLVTNGQEQLKLGRTGTVTLRKGPAAGAGVAAPGTGYRGSVHFQANTMTGDQQGGLMGLTWDGMTGSAPSTMTGSAQAGILVQSSGAYGTKMNLYTTNTYAGGLQRSLEIDHVGSVSAYRSSFFEKDTVGTMKRVAGNFGQHRVHATQTDFNATTMDFGADYVQGSTNGPPLGGNQHYNINLSLGSEYPYTQYVAQMCFPRLPIGGRPGIGLRFKEAGTWGSWYVIESGMKVLGGASPCDMTSAWTNRFSFVAPSSGQAVLRATLLLGGGYQIQWSLNAGSTTLGAPLFSANPGSGYGSFFLGGLSPGATYNVANYCANGAFTATVSAVVEG